MNLEREDRVAASDDTELNMTPMIDIVFQLIVFFLLSLKFKTLDERIEARLPNVGFQPTPQFEPPEPKIKVKAFRRNMVDPARAFTLLRVDNGPTFSLPPGWRGMEQESAGRRAAYRLMLERLEALILQKKQAYGQPGVRGEIVAPPPSGGVVPHGDVIQVLDAFLRAGITDVRFEGTLGPR